MSVLHLQQNQHCTINEVSFCYYRYLRYSEAFFSKRFLFHKKNRVYALDYPSISYTTFSNTTFFGSTLLISGTRNNNTYFYFNLCYYFFIHS